MVFDFFPRQQKVPYSPEAKAKDNQPLSKPIQVHMDWIHERRRGGRKENEGNVILKKRKQIASWTEI
jgi:hypothetical protein